MLAFRYQYMYWYGTYLRYGRYQYDINHLGLNFFEYLITPFGMYSLKIIVVVPLEISNLAQGGYYVAFFFFETDIMLL